MRQRLERFISIRQTYADAVDQRQATWLLVANGEWIALAVLLGIPLALWAIPESRSISLIFTVASIIIGVVTDRLIRQGKLSNAQIVFVGNLLGTLLLFVLTAFRVDTPPVILLTIPLTAAGILLGRRGLLITAGIIALAVIVGGILQRNAGMQTEWLGSTDAHFRAGILFGTITVIVNGLLLWGFVGGTEHLTQRLARLEHLVSATREVSQTLVDLPTESETLNRAVEQLRDLLGLYHVQVFVSDPVRGLAILKASTGYLGRRMLEEDSLFTPDENSPINEALRRKDARLILDTAPEDQRTGFLPATRSELLLPLRVGNLLPIGVLDMHSTRRDTFSQDMLDALSAIGYHMAVALHDAQQSLDLHVSYVERDHLIDQIGAAQRELARVNRQLVSATWGTYLEEQRDANAGFEWRPEGVAPSKFQAGASAATDSGEARLVRNGESEVLRVPIRLRGQTLGTVEFQRSSGGWSPAALELAQSVAARLALSLENARLFEQAQITAQREQQVGEITARMQTATDLNALLALAANQFQDALGAGFTRVRLGVLPSDTPDESG